MKVCSKCKIQKTIDSFSKDSSSKSGLYPSCKQCESKLSKSYYDKNKSKAKQYYLDNIDRVKEQDKSDSYRQYQVDYYQRNKRK